ncbi:hypothetical protein LBMAG20_16160 [Methylocystaceae bacterium]|nr:hypothetical protein LBMAG20_16160 [Methylocystaceae bacterium]
MTTHPALYAALALTVFLAGTTLSTRCLAQDQSIEESFNIFSDTDNQKKIPGKPNQKPKSPASEKQAPAGNCGQGEWAQCDYDGINN